MSKLSHSELRKEITDSCKTAAIKAGTYEADMQCRWEIFLKHLEEKKPLDVAGSKGGETIDTSNLNFIEAVRNRGKKQVYDVQIPIEVFIEKVREAVKSNLNTILYKGKEIKLTDFNTFLSQFGKTAEFGSSSGSAGAGSRKTAVVEATVAALCAQRRGTEAKLNEKKLSGKSNKDLLDSKNLDSLRDWQVQDTAACIDETIPKNLTEFHWQDTFVSKIGRAYSALKKNHPIYSHFKLDKWTPADIWATSPGFSFDFSSCTSLADLAKILYDNENCLGISLKKGGTTAHWRKIDDDRLRNYAIVDLSCSEPKLGTPSWILKYTLSGGTTQKAVIIRPSVNDFASIKAEIVNTGAKYRNGSIGGSGLEFIRKQSKLIFDSNDYGVDKIDVEDIQNKLVNILQSTNLKLSEEVQNRAETFCQKHGIDPYSLSLEDFKSRFTESDDISETKLKEYAIYVLEKELYNLREKPEFLNFIGNLHKLAVSDWDDHCTFLKVS